MALFTTKTMRYVYSSFRCLTVSKEIVFEENIVKRELNYSVKCMKISDKYMACKIKRNLVTMNSERLNFEFFVCQQRIKKQK